MTPVPYVELLSLFEDTAISSAALTTFAITSWFLYDCWLVRSSAAVLVLSCWLAITSVGYFSVSQYGVVEQAIAVSKSRGVSDVLVRNAEVVTPNGATFAFYRPAEQPVLRAAECCGGSCPCGGPCSCSVEGPHVCPDRLPKPQPILSRTAGRL